MTQKDDNSSTALHNKECDPTIILTNKKSTTKQEGREANIGILGCGDQEYCMESEYSSLGGFCATTIKQ